MRIGHGFDIHAFGPGSHVILGGVKIPHDSQGVQPTVWKHGEQDVKKTHFKLLTHYILCPLLRRAHSIVLA